MKVERDGELVLVREVVVEVTEEAEVEHEAHYVLTKFGSQEVKLDCTDFTENSHNWTRAGQADWNWSNPIKKKLQSKTVEGGFCPN